MTKQPFRFQIEHVIAENGLSDKVYDFLDSIGFDVNMRGNRTALFSESETVRRIQDGPQSFRDMLADGFWGWNRHDSTDRPAGFQKAKNRFLDDEFLKINGSTASEEAKRYAALELIEQLRMLVALK